MKKIIIALVTIAITCSCGQKRENHTNKDSIQDSIVSPVDLVNPLVGTLSSFELSAGNTYPVISRPWGMNSWTPQTGKMGDGWQYTYTAKKIRGFKQTHQPSPWINDYGQFSVMPVVGKEPIFDEDKRASWFSHKSEVAKPYYYEVYLADYDTEVAFAPTERAVVFEINYARLSKNEERWFVFDAFDNGSELQIELNENKVIGFSRKNSGGVPDNFKNYFVAKFDKSIKEFRRFEQKDKNGLSHTMLALRFEGWEKSSFKNKLSVWIASSFISKEQAEINLQEVEGLKLVQVEKEGRKEWNRLMNRIQIGDNVPARGTFYSNLYRSMLFPRRFYEINSKGDTIHYSPYNGEIKAGYMYTDTGLWDTFRALFPLVNLIFPEEGAKMQEGMLNAYRESGFFPEWASPGHRGCMVGNNSASVTVDAYLKGLGRIDSTELISALIHGANNIHPEVSSTGRIGWQYYNKLGYIPYNVGINESAARTLEYAYDDWCIYQVLKKTKASDSLQSIYKERAMNYKNLFDKETGWMRGRLENGEFQKPFNPLKWGDAFTEGNALHYTWSVFHDIKGLIDLMGGNDAFVKKLNQVFEMPPLFDDSYYGFVIHEIREMQIMNMGNYAHGNQPIQHMLYLYNYAGRPDLAQKYIREVMDKLYTNEPDGYCGDEDNGQTSAWYVFSALGFYPVTPASDQYVLGRPYFSDIKLNLPTGKTTINVENIDATNICEMKLNNEPLNRLYLTYDELYKGIKLNFKYKDGCPNMLKRNASYKVPYSFSDERVVLK